MGRRRKGRDISGWLVFDKPAGPSSASAVAKARWAFAARKAGHAGTLDPDATGVLPVALGEATKTIPYLGRAPKAYDFTMRFGAATDSDDASGTVIAESAARPTNAAIRAALSAFTGDIRQTPPRVSAVKVDGARAYDLARGGADFDLEPRDLHVAELTLCARPDADTAQLRFVCGPGGYVRAIARDLGAALGCLGHVLSLRRLRVGPFDQADAVSLAEIEAHARTPGIDALLRPVELALSGLPRLRATAVGFARLRNGTPGDVLPGDVAHGDVAWAAWKGAPVAVGRFRAGQLHPDRVFNL